MVFRYSSIKNSVIELLAMKIHAESGHNDVKWEDLSYRTRSKYRGMAYKKQQSN